MKPINRRLYLHIGTEKTGSTSIQAFLKINKPLLGEQGIGVPSELGTEMHFILQLMANDDNYTDSFTMNLELSNNAEERMALKQNWEERFIQEIQESTHQTWIISCETLQSRLRKTEEIARLKTILKKVFQEINIVLYLRDPISLYISRMTEQAKAAIKVELVNPELLRNQFDIANHKRTIQLWENSMGKGQMIVRLFEKSSMINGNVIDDFIEACDLPHCNYTCPKAHNQSLSKAGLMLLNEVNRYVPRRWLNKKIIPSRAILIRYFQKFMQKGERFLASTEEIETYNKYYEASNEWVRKKYFPQRNKLFREKIEHGLKADKHTYNQEDIEQAGILMANIWLIKSAQINFYKERYEELKRYCADMNIIPPSNDTEEITWTNHIDR